MSLELSHHVTVLELLWTIFGLVGIGFAIYNLIEALRELRTLRRSGIRGHRYRVLRIVATGGLRNAAVRLVKLGAVVMVGVLAMLTENPPETVPWTTLRYTVVITLLIIPALLTVQSLFDTLTLRKLQRELAETPQPGGTE